MNRFFRLLPRTLALLSFALLATGCPCDHLTDGDWCDRDCDRHGQITRSYDEVDFDEIEVHSAFHLTVRQSDSFQVRVTVPERSVDNIQLRRSGGRIRLSMEHGFLDGDVSATVELPLLRQVDAHDASEVRLERIESSGTVTLRLEDASKIRGELHANRTELDVSKASEATLDGRTDELKLDVSGVSEAHLRNLPTGRADVKVVSASSATIDVSDWLDVTAKSLAVLHYYGDPHLGRVDLSSGGRLEHEH
jgi:hypothetical protein